MWLDIATTVALALTTVAAAGNIHAPDSFYSALHPCPEQCAGTPEEWTVYPSVYRLGMCEQPMLFDFAIHNPLDDPSTTVKLRSCTAANTNTTSDSASRRLTSSACIPASQRTKQSLDLMTSGTSDSVASADLQTALDILQTSMADSSHCETDFSAAYYREVVVAVYSGSAIDNFKTLPSIMKELKQHILPVPKSITTQLCGRGRNADYTFGIAIDTSGNVAAVQKAVKSWSQATCVSTTQQVSRLSDVAWYEAPLPGGGSNSTNVSHHSRQLQERDGTCKTITVVAGDSCSSLARKCGISSNDFTNYNPPSDLCSTLQVSERVCCTSGRLPDITPKPYANGTCATYTVQSGDYCTKIAASNGLNSTQIELFNNGTTWGWNGCNDIMAGMNICLSTGKPPLPAPVGNALCGPTVPGTKNPTGNETLSDLNPCPLNVCCDIPGPSAQHPPVVGPPGTN